MVLAGLLLALFQSGYARAQDVERLTDEDWLTAFYVSYWGRSPDPQGLNYWVGQIQQGAVAGPADVAENFALQDEAKSAYPYFMAPQQAGREQIFVFVRSVYNNLLNLTPAEDDAGVQYWVGELIHGRTTPGAVIGNIIYAALVENKANWQTIRNKIEAGRYFAQRFAALGLIWNNAARDSARHVLANITQDPATVGSAKSLVDQLLQPGGSAVVGVRMDVCSQGVISGATRFVSPTGDDGSADGTMARPYKSVHAAAQNVQANETIVLRQGVYQEIAEIRIRVPGVTLRSHPGEWAVIDRSSETGQRSGVNFYVGSDGGSLQCVEVKGGFYAVSMETKWDWGDPSDRFGVSNILIENTRLHGTQADVVKIKPNCDDITIRHNEIFHSGVTQDPARCNAEGIDNVNGDRTLVANNHIHDICSTGVYLKGGATDGVIESNLIERTGAAGILLGFDTSPEFFDLTVNPEYYENIRGVARYNLVRETGWAGIGFYASRDAQAFNNTIVSAASQYHSPIYFGITFQDWEDYAGRPANLGPRAFRNIVVQPAALNAPLVSIRHSNELGGLSGLTGNPDMSENCYFQGGGAARFQDGRSGWSGNFVQWRAHINGEAGSLEVDPQLDADFKPRNPVCAGWGHAQQ